MTDFKIATGAEQPINTSGALAGEVFEQGTPVGIDPATGKMVKADADAASTIMAVGVAFGPTDDLANYSAMPDAVQSAVEAERTLIDRNRVSAVKYGIELENNDADSGFAPGEVVYLAPGGGYTQTRPTDASGDLVQILGTALTPERISVHVVPSDVVA